jgi:hypothetical protein
VSSHDKQSSDPAALCAKHSSEVDGQVVCDRCRRELEARRPAAELIDLDVLPPNRGGPLP